MRTKKQRVLAYFLAQKFKVFGELARKIGIEKESLWNKLHRGSPTWESRSAITRELNKILFELEVITEEISIEDLFTFINDDEVTKFIL